MRLIEQYGSAKAASDALWALARENEWYKEGEAAERYLLHRLVTEPAKNQTALTLIVAWHGAPIGHLTHDGLEWRWAAAGGNGPPLIRQTVPGKLPPFIVSLLPEGWLEKVLQEKDERTILRSGKRYMSNVTIVERQSQLAALPQDVLLTRLEKFTDAGRFTGHYAGPGRGDIEESFERNLAKIFSSAETPRLSGVQIKAPMYLDSDGTLSPSTAKPFTHILKPAGTSGFEALPIVEWTAMELGRAVGFEAPATALVAMPDDMPSALIVERFDIRQSTDDTRKLALEDFCSVLDLPPAAKYNGTMERIARAVRPLSTTPDEDVTTIFKRALFAWLIADGDMHLKNMALLKIAIPGEDRFFSVRMAPLYDAVTTRVFPHLGHDRMALKLNGKDDQLRHVDFGRFAATVGMKASDSDAAIEDALKRLTRAVEMFTLPKALKFGPSEVSTIQKVLDVVHDRIEKFK
jgi:serine/threonine-protein kinase HipA